ncbi:MAG: Rv2175c family DNA-binding protein [Nocardioidaceae bacterium]
MAEHSDTLVSSWLSPAEAADHLGVSQSKVRQLVRDHDLAMVHRAEPVGPAIPADFLQAGSIVKGLPGTLTLLADHGFDDRESVEWLFTAEESLPGRPIDALRADRGREVRRRAQAIV